MKIISNQKGVSIIAVVATMLILSVMGVVLISLVTTGSNISVNQLQSEQALNIAQGGVEYGLYTTTRGGGSWGEFTFTNRPLGAGAFTMTTNTSIVGGQRRMTIDSTGQVPFPGPWASRRIRTTANAFSGATVASSWRLSANGKEWVLGAVAVKPSGAIAYDSAGNNKSNSTTSLSWSHTCIGASRALLVGLTIGSATAAGSVTYAGVPMTYVGSQTYTDVSTIRAEIWRLVNPPTGANNVVVSLPVASPIAAGSISLTGVDQTTPLDSTPVFASGTTPAANSVVSVSVNTTTNNAWIIDVLAFKPTVQNAISGQNERWSDTAGAAVKGASSTFGPVAGNGVMSVEIIRWEDVY